MIVYALWDIGEGGKYLYDVFVSADAAKEWLAEGFRERGETRPLEWKRLTGKGVRDKYRCEGTWYLNSKQYGHFVTPMEVKTGTIMPP